MSTRLRVLEVDDDLPTPTPLERDRGMVRRTLCRRCLRAKPDRPRSDDLCAWCRLEPEGRDRAARARRGARQPLGAYCGRGDHERCTLGKHACGCTCHDPRATRPGSRRRLHRADALYDAQGRRVCACGALLIKKNPGGPGRYPDRCAKCKATKA